MEKIVIEKMQKNELKKVAEVLGQAFAAQPSSLVIYKGKGDIARKLGFVFGAMLACLPGEAYAGKINGEIVAGMRIVKWPDCQIKPWQLLRMFTRMVRGGGGLGALKRSGQFRGAWGKSDPGEAHWHLDPIGVRPDMQGKGIGGQMMEYYCNIIDSTGMAAYHETDKPENVTFYERFGYKAVKQETILGFENWYMWRNPKT